MSLKIAVEGSNPPTIALAGRLDTHTAPELDKTLDGVLAKTGITRLVFEVSQLEYLSSAGIRCFIRARKAIDRQSATSGAEGAGYREGDTDGRHLQQRCRVGRLSG